MENRLASRRSIGHYSPRYLAAVLVVVGIVTAALDTTFGGFAPILWFLLAIATLIIVTCNEVLRIADFLESKK